MSNVINLARATFEREFKEAHQLLMAITSGDPEFWNIDEILEALWDRAESLGLDPWGMDWELLEDAFNSPKVPDLTDLVIEKYGQI